MCVSVCVCVCVWILRETVCVRGVGFNSVQKLAHRVYYITPNVAKSDINLSANMYYLPHSRNSDSFWGYTVN